MATVFSQKMAHVIESTVGGEIFINSYAETYVAITNSTNWDSFDKNEQKKKEKEIRAEATLDGLTAVARAIFPDTLHDVIANHIFSKEHVSDIYDWQFMFFMGSRDKNRVADELDSKFRDRIVESLPLTWSWIDEQKEFDTMTDMSHEVFLARVRHLTGELERVREEREQAIIEAVKAGVSVAKAGKAAGLTPQAVYTLRRRRLYRKNNK